MNIFYYYLHTTTYYKCGGVVEGSEEGEVQGTRLIFTARGPWVGLQALAKHMGNLWSVRT